MSAHLCVVHCPVVVDGVVDGDVSLEGDGDGHEHGAGQGDPLKRVLTVGEQDDLQKK